MDLALNNLQMLICHKTQQTKPNHFQYVEAKAFSGSNSINSFLTWFTAILFASDLYFATTLASPQLPG